MAEQYFTLLYRWNGDKALFDEWWRAQYPIFMNDEAPISIVSVALNAAPAKKEEAA